MATLAKPSMNKLVLLMFILFAPHANADYAHCYSIQNQDQKNFCLATAKNEKSYCYSIHEADNKNMCLALVSNQKNYCYSIRTNDYKNQCLGVVR